MIIKKLSSEEFWPIFRENRDKYFSDTLSFSMKNTMTQYELETFSKRKEAFKNQLEYHYGLFTMDGSLAGWSSSFQSRVNELHMMNSVVFPAYRRQGYYTKMVEETIKEAGLMGFQTIISYHVSTNNDVIIPKLKLGFKIVGMILDDEFGTLVKLSYYLNELRSDALDFRAGLIKPNQEVKQLFKI